MDINTLFAVIVGLWDTNQGEIMNEYKKIKCCL